MFKRMQSMQMQAVHCFRTVSPNQREYRAIIALHNTHLGPALGGCRCRHYQHEQLAFDDAMRLAQGMSYKAALANVEQGGGKAVILLPSNADVSGAEREFLFTWFGQCVESLAGQYITAMDVGTQVTDMDVVARETHHVASASNIGDPAESTALGVMEGIRAALDFNSVINNYSVNVTSTGISGKTFAVQGLGHVGWRVAEQLLQQGGKVIAADPDEGKCKHAQDLGIEIVDINNILAQECDVLVPCALGGIINDDNVIDLNCKILAGSANNQLTHDGIAEKLKANNILYAPDFIINAGGLIFAAMQYANALDKAMLETTIKQKIEGIYDTLIEIFKHAQSQNKNINEVAIALAISRLEEKHDINRPNKGAVYDAA